ncbi:extracellular solute-binding protein [Candidatus Uhrbacteria bacterium]|nr:extracellular solute-binding protein [Candidatus Uhrbacteria bacterium]
MILRRIGTFFLLILFLSTTGLSCTLLGPSGDAALFAPVTLEYWRVYDPSDSLAEISAAYNNIHKNVAINFRTFRYEEYEQQLLDALAEDRGPDMFSLPNSWIGRYETKILPMPRVMKVGYVKRTKEDEPPAQSAGTQEGYTAKQIQTLFLEAVTHDVTRRDVKGDVILGLPYSMDVLALFFNRDLLNNESIDSPPTTWTEFEEAVKKITKIDEETQKILQSGAAFGGGKSIQRASDVISMLMMQNGAEMTQNGAVVFDRAAVGGIQVSEDGSPALNALQYYTDFASPGKEYYTWDDEGGDSFEAFSQGRTAFFFGYSYHDQLLKQKAPRLRYGVVPVPQIGYPNPQATFANYWVETVSKKTRYPQYTWDFLRFATQKDQAEGYLKRTRKPTALRALVETQKRDEDLEPFASQLLFAKSWYQGKNPRLMERAFVDMISDGLLNAKTGEDERGQLGAILKKTRERISAGYDQMLY